LKRRVWLAALCASSACAWFTCHAAERAASGSTGDPGGRSIYLLDSRWTADNGRPRRLRELGGDVQILTLMYATCTGICPGLVKELQALSRNLPADIDRHTHFVLVTVDPQHDTVAALRQYRQDMKLDDARFTLLRGSAADVRELAAVLGFNYQQIDSGQFAHSNLVTVLDPHGQVAHQQNGLAGDGEGVIDAIRQALSAGRAPER
jgi:protein SCO1/2